jgi:peptidoglycan/xylan/chitin deacetylase (PgdA/CDA1 family)
MDKKYISIIFDDGPRYPMREMIDKFIEYGFKCGFAIVSNRFEFEDLSVLKYAIDNGFELCSHSHSHPRITELDKETATEEMMRPIREVEKLFGYKIKVARLPYLYINETLSQISIENNLPLMGHGIAGAPDWQEHLDPEIISNSIKEAYDGAIVCLHVTRHTCDSLDKMLGFLKENNFVAVNPSDLFEIKKIKNIPLGVNINKV